MTEQFTLTEPILGQALWWALYMHRHTDFPQYFKEAGITTSFYFFKQVRKNEIRRHKVAQLSHRASNGTGKHPGLPILEHSTILLSGYMTLDLPLGDDLWRSGPLQKRSQLNGQGRCTCISLTTSTPF